MADYGLSTIKDSSSIHFCGAVPWRAPEVEPNVFLPASDVYSFGVILWELVTRLIPYEGRDLREVISEVKKGVRLPIPPNCPKFLMELINNCWNPNPDYRPTFHDIIETLKPMEISANSSQNQIVTCVHDDANLVHLRETDWILSELVVCQGNHMIGKIWTTFFTHQQQEKGSMLLKENFIKYKSETTHHGMLTLVDDYGRTILIVGLNSKESLQEFDRYFHQNCNTFDSLIDIVCSPIISETYKLVTYNIKSSAKFAHVIQMEIKEGFGKDTLEIFENYGVSGLSRSLISYCGSLVLSDFNSGKCLIVILYENEDGMIELENSGFFQQQMNNFSSFIITIPTIQKYRVEDDSFQETHLESPLLSSSDSNIIITDSNPNLTDIIGQNNDQNDNNNNTEHDFDHLRPSDIVSPELEKQPQRPSIDHHSSVGKEGASVITDNGGDGRESSLPKKDSSPAISDLIQSCSIDRSYIDEIVSCILLLLHHHCS